MPRIVVVGAGVAGLTSALLLAKDKENVVTVIAKHMPGDYDIQYASPWAGANYLPMSTPETSRWERRSWPELRRLAVEVPEAGIHLQKALVYRNAKDLDPNNKASGFGDDLFNEKPWYTTFFPDYRRLADSELPPGMAYGHEFGSLCINTAIYLPWLVGQCRNLGVVFKRATLSHISEAAALHQDSETSAGNKTTTTSSSSSSNIIIINATGLGALKPGGGTVLGGTYAKGNWDPNPDPNIANRIMQRIAAKFPQITGGKGVEGLDVIRHGVGLRPYREGGVRLEKELVGDVWVVHNYGHAGWGYQGSYGTAERVVELVGEILGRAAPVVQEKGRL
ncbi:nucleotide-binding domain-containing protein [Cryphonectria parasitica EP155]|uniref:Nucleotide-binding domain-containing protein n=1 Tax=Cryphonectria parasitica (strain ATCC 38755 / EP155) TaxID=660469 RepID=A0A9P4Y548_CRYP1|nr:nucleotide-binding domain-containing protein [Cryphonectria parasitica EP155]KAF3767107.1 nucleotide-binding domain-containing protein [Cryphonectria parasitica EP155]